jgi:GWxTD domain-containing protein
MNLIPRQNLLAGLLLASVSFQPVSGRTQDPTPAARTTRSWLQDPTINEEYKKWLREDVAWIITDEERASFKTLATDKQRDEFVAAFWEPRNPTPRATRNAYKEEHYRRLAYANTHFAANIPGWKTDRVRMYIMFGPPDKIIRLLSGNTKRSDLGLEGWPRLYIENFGQLAHHVYESQHDRLQENPFDSEEWHWNYIEGIGQDVTIKFVDTCFCGEYSMQIDENDPHKYRPK